jgi:thiol-disulfide isomerase/thioredoxin
MKMIAIRIGVVLWLLFIVTGWWFRPALAAETTVYFFWSQTCPHCVAQKPVMERIAAEYPEVRLVSLEVSTNRENARRLEEAGRILGTEIIGVPFTVVGEKYLKGWPDTEAAEQELEQAITACVRVGCVDPLGPGTKEQTREADELMAPAIPETLNLPLVGAVKTAELSLPLLTVAIAFLDGFNPCAMWVLLFLISLLVTVQNPWRRWGLGLAFLGASGAVYFVFLAAWLNVMLVVGMVYWVRVAVGLVAVGAGVMHLRDWYLKQVACVVGSSEKRQKVFARIRALIGEQRWWVAFLGIVALAVAVNVVELICSFALPAAYTSMLTLQNLPMATYYGYLLLYLVVFMLDDLVVFAAAMITMQVVGVGGRWGRLVALLGGLLMVGIGLALLFKPTWLAWGTREWEAAETKQQEVGEPIERRAETMTGAVVVAEGLEIPWEVVELGDGTLLVTERAGSLVRIYPGRQEKVAVEGVTHRGEGGLLGMALHPDYAENQRLYLMMTVSSGGG